MESIKIKYHIIYYNTIKEKIILLNKIIFSQVLCKDIKHVIKYILILTQYNNKILFKPIGQFFL